MKRWQECLAVIGDLEDDHAWSESDLKEAGENEGDHNEELPNRPSHLGGRIRVRLLKFISPDSDQGNQPGLK